MAVTEKAEEPLDWNVDMEVQLFHAMRGHKPVGVNRYFQMACIHEKFSNSMNKEIYSQHIWTHLDTMYDMAALNAMNPGVMQYSATSKATYHESEILPFPNGEVEFSLPFTEFGDLIAKRDGSLGIMVSTPTKSVRGDATPVKATSVPNTPSKGGKESTQTKTATTPGSNVTPTKGGKGEITPVKSESKALREESTEKPSTKNVKGDTAGGKSKSENTPSTKAQKGSSATNTPKNIKVETNTGSSTKASKADGHVNGSGKKSLKMDAADTPKKSHKTEAGGNGSGKKTNKAESGYGSGKKVHKFDLTGDGAGKKPSKTENSESGTKKTKSENSDGGTKKTKADNTNVSNAKSIKSDSKTHLVGSGGRGGKGDATLQDDGSSNLTATPKSSKAKEDVTENSAKRKRQGRQQDDQGKKSSSPASTPATKRRRT